MAFREKINALRTEYNATLLEVYTKFQNKMALNDNANIQLGSIIGLAVGIIVIAAVAPAALDQFYAADTTNWTINGAEDTKATAIWWLIPFIIVIVFLYMVYKRIEN